MHLSAYEAAFVSKSGPTKEGLAAYLSTLAGIMSLLVSKKGQGVRMKQTLLRPVELSFSRWCRLVRMVLTQFLHPPPSAPPLAAAKSLVPPKPLSSAVTKSSPAEALKPSPAEALKPSPAEPLKPSLKVSALAPPPFQSAAPLWKLVELQNDGESQGSIRSGLRWEGS